VKPGTATKDFVERDDVFLDFLSLAYPKLMVEKLTSLPERMLSERRRDVAKGCKVAKDGREASAILLIERQTLLHHAMPLRMLAYECEELMWALSKRKGVNKSEKKTEAGSEFLSGVKSGEKLPIALSLVAYWGKGEWKAPMALSEVCQEFDGGMWALMQRYGITLVDVMRLKEEEMDGLKSNLRVVVLYLQCDDNEERITEVIKGNSERLERMCLEGVEVLKALANVDISDAAVNERGEVSMKSAWDARREKGIRVGRKEGVGIGDS